MRSMRMCCGARSGSCFAQLSCWLPSASQYENSMHAPNVVLFTMHGGRVRPSLIVSMGCSRRGLRPVQSKPLVVLPRKFKETDKHNINAGCASGVASARAHPRRHDVSVVFTAITVDAASSPWWHSQQLRGVAAVGVACPSRVTSALVLYQLGRAQRAVGESHCRGGRLVVAH